MADGVRVDIIGSKDLQAKFSRLAGKEQKAIIRKAMRPAWKTILAESKRLVPVDRGLLKRGLKLRALKRSRTSFGLRVVTPDRPYLGIRPKAPGYYPAALEYGTKNMRARPYLRPAFKSHKGSAKVILGRGIRDGMRRLVR